MTSHPESFALPHARDALTEDGWADPAESERMAQWAVGFALAALPHAEERASKAA